MNTIDINNFSAAIEEQLTENQKQQIESSLDIEQSSARFLIAGNNCVTTIIIRETGSCDIDFLFTMTDDMNFFQYDFASTSEATETVFKEILAALSRG